MSGFSAASVDALEYDFTGFRRQDGQGACTGAGTIPEPSEAALDAFLAKWGELRSMSPEELEAKSATLVNELREALSELCSGTPSLEELKQLPPRVLRGFFRYIMVELTDPKG